MAKDSTRRRRLSTEAAKHLPYPDFPLSPHAATNRWYKVIKGKRWYFGSLADPDAALALYELQREDIRAGRTPRLTPATGVTVADVLNRFMTAKRQQVEQGDIKPKTWDDLFEAGERVVSVFGRGRAVVDLRPEDFTALRASLAKSMKSPVVLGIEMQRIRSIFKWAWESDLIEHPVKFGPQFKAPSRKRKRQARQEAGRRMFTAPEARALIDAAGVPLRAMVLLGLNAGLGNTDAAELPIEAVDLDRGWLDFPRVKTAVERRAPLWPETVAAIREALEKRPKPASGDDKGILFITKYGKRWTRSEIIDLPDGKHRLREVDSVNLEFGKLRVATKIVRRGVAFYALRHTFRTVADELPDEPAIDRIMGHERTEKMSTAYRERIDDDRLRAVTDHVRRWLFEGGK